MRVSQRAFSFSKGSCLLLLISLKKKKRQKKKNKKQNHRPQTFFQHFPTFEITYLISARLTPCLPYSISARVCYQGQCFLSLTLAGLANKEICRLCKSGFWQKNFSCNTEKVSCKFQLMCREKKLWSFIYKVNSLQFCK